MAEMEVRTRIIKVDPLRPDPAMIVEAAKVIRLGGLVAFPTETVYGLGADAFYAPAVSRIFEVKGRPLDNPVIVHISSRGQVELVTREVPPKAEELMDNFWPGPLTIIMKRAVSLPEVTVAGLDTVAVRMPDHNVAMALISEARTPIAAPSANLSGLPSPTRADHVIRDLYGKVEAIIDGGNTPIGVESTVLDMTTTPPVILRPGKITPDDLRNILGKVEVHPGVLDELKFEEIVARSPGMKHRHYAPRAQLILVEGELERIRAVVQRTADELMGEGKKVGILSTDNYNYRAHCVVDLGPRSDAKVIASNLFSSLRDVDQQGVDVIISEGFEPKGLCLAIENRLRKASGGNVIRA